MRLILLGLYLAPLVLVLTLDAFCFGKGGCSAGVVSAFQLYGIGIGVFLVALVCARLMLHALRARPRTRLVVVISLFLIPLVSALIVFVALLLGFVPSSLLRGL